MKVTYGAKGKTVDATAKVKLLTAKGGSVTLNNYNSHFGDPIGGTVEDYARIADKITAALQKRIDEVMP